MPANISVVDLGKLSKPATVLIEKISDAVGGVFKPSQIRRVAEAEAYADKVRELAKIEITDLHRRAAQRWIQEEAARQQNIEDITRLALPEVSENARPQDIETDWITNFFDKCRLVSDEAMQRLWARILAGEADSPGKFSKRTIALIATLDKPDAELFTALCKFCWEFEFDHSSRPIIYNRGERMYLNAGLNLATLLRLEESGLIFRQEVAATAPDFIHGGFRSETSVKAVTVAYHGVRIDLDFKHAAQQFPYGQVRLSRAGQELATVFKSSPADGFIEYAVSKWMTAGLHVAFHKRDEIPESLKAVVGFRPSSS